MVTESGDNPDPAQGELDLGDEEEPQPALADYPWQIELGYRLLLNTGIVALALLCRRFLDWFAQALGFAEIPWAVGILVTMFNASIVPFATVAVVFDFIRFSYRRMPTSWKRKLQW